MLSTNSVTVGVPREHAPDETRVALVPAVVPALRRAGLRVVVEAGAGAAAGFPDAAYTAAGAIVRPELGAVTVVVGVGTPQLPLPGHPRLVIGLLDDRYTGSWEPHGITGLDLHRLPHTLSQAREMDALASQATVTGYKAAVLAADTLGDFLGTPATTPGSEHSARVLVLGAGVAGLEAIATAIRLGADVTGYDVRAAAREAILTQGARLLTLPGVADVTGVGGHARTLTGRERRRQKIALAEHMADFDIVITCASLPGRRPPPELIDARGLAVLAPGSVVVDTASGPLGGNVADSVPGSTVVRVNGVVLIGAADLPRRMARGASAAYARCVVAVIRRVVADDGPHVDPADDVIGPMLVGAPPPVDRVPGPETIPEGHRHDLGPGRAGHSALPG